MRIDIFQSELEKQSIHLYIPKKSVSSVSLDKINKKVQKSYKHAEIINTTNSFREYINSFETLIIDLNSLKLIENTTVFGANLPSKDLRELQQKHINSQKNFINRFIDKYGKDSLKSNKSYFIKFLPETINYINLITQSEIDKFSDCNINANLEFITNNLDYYFIEAGKLITNKGIASIGMLQRVYKISFNRAVKIMEQLYIAGVVGPENGSNPRNVLMTTDEFELFIKSDAITNINIDNLNGNKITNSIDNQKLTQTHNNDFDNMNGYDFEYFCADLLKHNGFYNVEVTQGSGDHGIDLLAEKDGISYAIQCKCYSNNVGNSAIQQAHTGKSLYSKDIAVVMTNQYFTKQAIDEAEQLRVKL